MSVSLKRANALVLGCFLAGAPAMGHAHAASPGEVPTSAYEHPQTLVTLADGRRLNLFCLGSGSPTVVMEAGGGDDSLSFQAVQARVANVTRVCSYDRAGMGFSDPSPYPTTLMHVIADLHGLLDRAHIGRPIVLVGHSDGGLYAAFYAATYGQQVGGMVLIDPDSPGLDQSALSVLDQPWLTTWRSDEQRDIAQARDCLTLARRGALIAKPSQYATCLDDPPHHDAALHHLLDTQLSRPTEQSAIYTQDVDTTPAANNTLSPAEKVFQATHFDFGDKPFVILSGTNEQSGLPLAERTKVNQAMLANQAELAARSSEGRQILIDSSTEYLQLAKPDVVVQAITEVVEKVRKRSAS
ncbi:alpha/beta fold hydrolase [Dyella monticola]|nr:alpha/beta hydrolase [Dyella monticola]